MNVCSYWHNSKENLGRRAYNGSLWVGHLHIAIGSVSLTRKKNKSYNVSIYHQYKCRHQTLGNSGRDSEIKIQKNILSDIAKFLVYK